MTARYEDFENYETWAVANAIDNDEAELSEVLAHLARKSDRRPRFVEAEFAADIEKRVRHAHGIVPEALRTELSGRLSLVNWRELAEHYMAKAAEGVR